MIRNVLLVAALCLSAIAPASALPPPDYQVAAQSEELRFPVADLATADDANVAIVAPSPALDRPALAYEAALFFETSTVGGSPTIQGGAFAPIDPGRLYIA